MAEFGVAGARRHRGFTAKPLVRLLSGALLCGACDDQEDFGDLTGDDEFRLSAVQVPNADVAPFGNETSAISFPQGPIKLFVSFNAHPADPYSDGTESHCGWAVSGNGLAFLWAHDYPLPAFPSYGLSGDGRPYDYCLGDTHSINASWTTDTNIVAMVAVARNEGEGELGCPSEKHIDVAMWTSNDGGADFDKVKLLSTTATSGGCADGPKVAWDPTNKKAWVTWWNAGNTFLRSVSISNTGAMTLGPLRNLTFPVHLLEETAPTHVGIAIKPAAMMGQNPTIWLAYASEGGGWGNCVFPPSPPDIAVRWWLSKSTDGGLSFSEHQEIDYDPDWPQCISRTPLGSNRAMPAVAYDVGSQRVLLAYPRHVDDAAGNYVGTRVVKAQTPRANGNPGFDKWVTICNPQLCPGQPSTGETCDVANGVLPVGETICHQYGAAIGVKSGGIRRFAVVWHDTHDSEWAGYDHPDPGDESVVPLASHIRGVAFKPGGPILDCIPPVQCKATPLTTPFGDDVPWPEVATNGNLWWGDYEDGVVPFGSKFYAIWGDNRDGALETNLKGAAFDE